MPTPCDKPHRSAESPWPFRRERTVIGVLHLPALPGSPRHAMPIEAIVQQACEEAELFAKAGFDGIIVENFGDAPFWADRVPAETTAAMTRIVTEVIRAAPQIAVGLNVLRNDAEAAVAIAAACGGRFVRVNVHTGVYATDQGLLQGNAARTLRLRQALRAELLIFADVHVKHAQPLSQPDLAAAAQETAYRGLADGLIVTGPATSSPVELEHVRIVTQAVPDRPVLIGSGVTAATVREALEAARGVIVGSALRVGGRAGETLDPERLRAFAQAAGLLATEADA